MPRPKQMCDQCHERPRCSDGGNLRLCQVCRQARLVERRQKQPPPKRPLKPRPYASEERLAALALRAEQGLPLKEKLSRGTD